MPVLLTTVSPVLAEYLTPEAPHKYVLSEGMRKKGMQGEHSLWGLCECAMLTGCCWNTPEKTPCPWDCWALQGQKSGFLQNIKGPTGREQHVFHLTGSFWGRNNP